MIRRLACRTGLAQLSVSVLLAASLLLYPLLTTAQNAPNQPSSSDPSATAVIAAPSLSSIDAKWQQDLAAWRAEREKQIDASDGWLALIGLEWLKPGINSFGAAPDNQIRVRAKAPDHIGVLTVIGKAPHPMGEAQHPVIVQLLAPNGGFPPDLEIDGKPAREGPLTVEGPVLSTITWHGLNMVVMNRGGRYLLRIKDADSTTRAGFHGLNWYAPDPKYRIRAIWTPYPSPRIVKIPTVLGTTLDFPSPGFVEFVLNGKPFNLEPVTEPGEDGTLFFILKDLTSGITTYATARYLHTGLPDHGLSQPGLLTLDFNRLENPPCAYTPYASCPLPPEQNQLPIALPAGEQLYTPQ
jgi:uncharacterized protein (DUF1684 family)